MYTTNSCCFFQCPTFLSLLIKLFNMIFSTVLVAGAVEGNLLASLAPPVHLTGEKLGLTLLVCVVSDFRRGHLEINWRSASDEGYSYASPYNGAVTRKHRGHSAVAIITVVTSNWPSYSCSVRRRKHSRAKKLHNIASTGNDQSLNLFVMNLIQQHLS